MMMNSKIPNGYNLTNGGEGKYGCKWSENQYYKRKSYIQSDETKEKIRVALKGRIRPADVRTKISKGLSGRKLSEETIAKLKERIYTTEIRGKMSASAKSKKVTEETKAKMSAAQSARQQRERNINKLDYSFQLSLPITY